jgi:hypothetical protein
MRHDELTDADLEAVVGGMGLCGKGKKEAGASCDAPAAAASTCCG